MRSTQIIPRLAISGAMLLLTLIYLYPITSTHQWYYSHAQDSYLYVMEMFRDSFSHGNWYPRWLPDLQGGYGYTTFLFTAPAFFFLTLPFTYLFSDIVFCFYASLSIMTMAGAFGAYKFARLYCPAAASMLCVVLFFTSHYLAINLFARGDLTEYSAMMLCPWLMYFFIRLADDIKQKYLPMGIVVGLTVTLFSLMMMHPLVFLYCAIPGTLVLTGKWAEGGYKLKLPMITGLCLIIALALSSPFWLTAIQLKPYLNQGGVFMTDRAASLFELFNDGFFNPGKLQAALAFTGFALARRNLFMRYVFASYLLLLLLMTRYADAFWQLDTPMKYSQFPWRLNSVVAIVQLMGMIQFMTFLSLQLNKCIPVTRNAIWCTIAASILLITMFNPITQFPFLAFKNPFLIWGPIDYPTHKVEWEHSEFIYGGVYREFFPATADYEHLPNRLLTYVPMVVSDSRVTMQDDSSHYRIHFTITVPDDAAILINQMYFPGWKILVNNRPAMFTSNATDKASWSIGDHGRLRLRLPTSGSYDVLAWYDGPPGWEMRNLCIALLVGACIFLLYRERPLISRQ